MQSLESTCQEADYMLNDAFCKLKKSPITKQQQQTQSTLLIDQSYPNVSSPIQQNNNNNNNNNNINLPTNILSSTLLSETTSALSSIVSENNISNIGHQIEKRGATDLHDIAGGSPPKKSKISSTIATTTFNTNCNINNTNNNNSNSNNNCSSNLNSKKLTNNDTASSSVTPISCNNTNLIDNTFNVNHKSNIHFNIHDRLKELYLELLYDEDKEANKLNLRSTSFLLEKLIIRENLNTLILNLHPGNKGYSLVFRKYNNNSKTTSNTTDILINSQDTSSPSSSSRSSSTKINQAGAAPSINCNEILQETVRWPYEDEDLLEYIDNEELPLILVDIIESKCPNLFYSGCVIIEVRDYRQSFPIYNCDTYHVLLKPTNQTLIADVNLITSEGDWSNEDKLVIESQLVLATAEPLCLDPNPEIGKMAVNQQHRRQLLNTPAIRRHAKKFSQVSINRKRKIDQFTHNFGLELYDFINRYKPKTRNHTTVTSMASTRLLKKASEIVTKIEPPNLDLPPDLSVPEDVNVQKYAKVYERQKETKDCMPQLIEEYILETDRGGGRVYHIKLTIFQRPANSEFLGELYVDRDFKEGERNGESCQFSLGTRAQANRYILQFTEIFTEEGRKSVKITHIIPGQAPKTSCTHGMWQQQQQQQQQIQQIQQQIQIQPSTSGSDGNSVTGMSTILSPVAGNAPNSIMLTQPNQIVGQTTSSNLLTALGNPPQHLIQQPQQTYTINSAGMNSDLNTVNIQINTQQNQQIPQLNLNSASIVLLQQQPGSNLPNLIANSNNNRGNIVAATQQQQQQNTIIGNSRNTLNTSVPLLTQQIHIQQKSSDPTVHSTNPAINALATGLMDSANQFQQQAASNAANRSNSNAAIISLLNSAPAAMTNSAVVNNTMNSNTNSNSSNNNNNNSSNNLTNVVQTDNISNRKNNINIDNTGIQHVITQNALANTIRKFNLQTQNAGQLAGTSRININPANLISLSTVGGNNIISQAQLLGLQQSQTGGGIASDQQHGITRVTMSALASQLSSPPAIMSNATIQQQQQQGFLNITGVQNNSNGGIMNSNHNNTVKTQQILLNNVNQRGGLNSQNSGISVNTLRRDSLTIASSPGGSDSNASSVASTSNLSFTMPGLSALLATTSPSSVLSDVVVHQVNSNMNNNNNNININNNSNSNSNNNNNSNSALIERLTSGNINTQQNILPSQNPSLQFTTNPKNIQQQMQIQSSISPLSSPPPQQQQQHHSQTTTVNLQGLNLASLQDAMATIPGLQNVQVQIPGLAQPLSISLSNAGSSSLTTANNNNNNSNNNHPSLLVSVPVTSTNQVVNNASFQQQAVPSSVVPIVSNVLDSSQQTGTTGSILSLPFGLNDETIRISGNQFVTVPKNRTIIGKRGIITTTGSTLQRNSYSSTTLNITTTTTTTNVITNQPIINNNINSNNNILNNNNNNNTSDGVVNQQKQLKFQMQTVRDLQQLGFLQLQHQPLPHLQQQQQQQQQQHQQQNQQQHQNLQTSQSPATIVTSPSTPAGNIIAGVLQGKHRRRSSTADASK